MGIRTNNRSVDFDKLNIELHKRGLNMGSASKEMGRSSSYLGGMKKKGYLPTTTLILFDTIWNIKYEDIEPTKIEEAEVVEEPKATEEFVMMSKEELRYIITEAVKDAFTWYANL